jgi:predicted phage terminase large subunit-like protein
VNSPGSSALGSDFARLLADRLDPPPDDDRELARRCAAHLPTFIREAWPILEPATEYVHGWHVDVVAEHLEAVTRREILRLIINQPPRTMKSLTAAVFWPAWEWLEHPFIRWLFASYASQLSQRDSMKMRRLIKSKGGAEEGTIFQRIGYQGVLKLLSDDPWTLEKDQDAKTKYETTATGFRLATSVDAMATGEGGDRIVVDDALSAKQARSDAERVNANEWWSETMSSRFNNDAAAAVIVQQRLHEEDLTGYLLGRGEWHHLCLPAEYEPSHPFVYPDSVTLPLGRELPGDPRTEEGELLEPVRLGREKLDELLREQGTYGYAGQLQQRPAPAEGGMFKKHWWKRYRPEDLPPWPRYVASWDMRFSDSQKESSSYVVGQVWAIQGADRYLVGQVRARLSFTETLKAVLAVEQWQTCNAKLIEKKANGEAVLNTFKKTIAGMVEINPKESKEARAAAISPQVEAGNVWLPESEFIPAPPPSEWTEEDGTKHRLEFEPTRVDDFLHECAVFPNGAHDDQVDSLSQVLDWLAKAPLTGAPIIKTARSRHKLG